MIKKLTHLFFFTAVGVLFFSGDFDEATQFGFASVIIKDAEARVGRPLTPVSVGGVRRRTRRRTAAVTAAVVATPTVVVGTSIGALPSGCTSLISGGVTYHSCSGVYYKPVFSGNTVTYVVVNQP